MRPAIEPALTEDILLRCDAPLAFRVSLIGDFNAWNPWSHLMERHSDGSWRIHVALSRGTYHYLFIIDGKSELDQNAMCVEDASRKEKVSLLAIS